MREQITEVLQAYPVAAPLLFIIIRSLAIIIPPVQGIVLDLAGIFIFGWLLGLVYAEVGVMFGVAVAFWVARKFREPLLKRFVSLQKLHNWEAQYSEKQQFWTLVVIRFFTSPFFDYITYAAGLTKIRPTVFFWSTFVGTLPLMFAIYYFGGIFLEKNIYYIAVFIFFVLILGYIFKRWSERKYLQKK